MERVGWPQDREKRTPVIWDRWAIVVVAAVVSVAVVTLYPSVDLLAARQFRTADDTFIGLESSVLVSLREVLLATYVVACGLCVAGLVITRDRVRPFLSIGFVKWLFLALCISVGPGVVANLALKDHMGRARPRDLVEFGGTKSFSAAMVPANECVRNCSFVCGESSSLFALFFAAACVARRRAFAFIAGGLATGSLAGLVRMSQGAHFLSDVVYSGVFMALCVLALRWLSEAIAGSAQAEQTANHAEPGPSVAWIIPDGAVAE